MSCLQKAKRRRSGVRRQPDQLDSHASPSIDHACWAIQKSQRRCYLPLLVVSALCLKSFVRSKSSYVYLRTSLHIRSVHPAR